MMRHLLEGLPVVVSEAATSSGEAREYLRDNPDTRLVLLDDGLQHLPLVRRASAACLPCGWARGCCVAERRRGRPVAHRAPPPPRRRRDLEIVMVNSLSPFGNGHLLPRCAARPPLASACLRPR